MLPHRKQRRLAWVFSAVCIGLSGLMCVSPTITANSASLIGGTDSGYLWVAELPDWLAGLQPNLAWGRRYSSGHTLPYLLPSDALGGNPFHGGWGDRPRPWLDTGTTATGQRWASLHWHSVLSCLIGVFFALGCWKWWLATRKFPPRCCQHCGYDLTGASEPRCSECGRDRDSQSPVDSVLDG